MNERFSIDLWDETHALHFVGSRYAQGGRLRLDLVSVDKQFCTLTVNVPDATPIEKGRVIIKDYSENEEVWAELLRVRPQWFCETGMFVVTGWVEAPVIELTDAFFAANPGIVWS